MKFLPSVSIQVFRSVKTTGTHEGNLRAERIRNSGTQFLCVPCLEFGAHVHHKGSKHATWDTFLRNHEHNRVPEISLIQLKKMPIYYP